MKNADNLLTNFYEEENGCWVWTKAKTTAGYGRLGAEYTHRLSYELFIGEIPKNYCIDHLCRNRACLNPQHLEAVTQAENKLRGVGAHAVNARKTHCIKGHRFTAANTRLKNDARRCKRCEYLQGVKFKENNPDYNREWLRQWRARKKYA